MEDLSSLFGEGAQAVIPALVDDAPPARKCKGPACPAFAICQGRCAIRRVRQATRA
jgi:hypothetical protein